MADEPEQEERTEAATPRRREDARDKGQVPLSGEFVTTLLLFAWASMFLLAGGDVARLAGGTITGVLADLPRLGTRDVDLLELAGWVSTAARPAAKVVGLLAGSALFFALLLSYGQIGFRISPKALALDWARVSPIKGFGRLFSARSWVRTALASMKILVVVTTVAVVAWLHVDHVILASGSDIGPVLAAVGYVTLRCLISALTALLLLALVDLLFQRWQHEQDMRMTRKEVRDELKSTEGDPHIKARIRRVQRELASRRMMADVPTATVVVTNPTHYAVALKYERDGGSGPGAPRVVAKGIDAVAQRIKEVAREAGVLCYEDVPLARALHARVEIGEEVPVDLYTAVAEVLAYVFRVQGLSGTKEAGGRA